MLQWVKIGPRFFTPTSCISLYTNAFFPPIFRAFLAENFTFSQILQTFQNISIAKRHLSRDTFQLRVKYVGEKPRKFSRATHKSFSLLHRPTDTHTQPTTQHYHTSPFRDSSIVSAHPSTSSPNLSILSNDQPPKTSWKISLFHPGLEDICSTIIHKCYAGCLPCCGVNLPVLGNYSIRFTTFYEHDSSSPVRRCMIPPSTEECFRIRAKIMLKRDRMIVKSMLDESYSKLLLLDMLLLLGIFATATLYGWERENTQAHPHAQAFLSYVGSFWAKRVPQQKSGSILWLNRRQRTEEEQPLMSNN